MTFKSRTFMHYYANYIFMNTIKIAEADQTRISLTK